MALVCHISKYDIFVSFLFVFLTKLYQSSLSDNKKVKFPKFSFPSPPRLSLSPYWPWLSFPSSKPTARRQGRSRRLRPLHNYSYTCCCAVLVISSPAAAAERERERERERHVRLGRCRFIHLQLRHQFLFLLHCTRRRWFPSGAGQNYCFYTVYIYTYNYLLIQLK